MIDASLPLVLERLRLLEMRPAAPTRHFLLRWLRWSGTVAGRWMAGFLTWLIWLSFVAQVYISEFFNHHQAQGWLNQPLVQLPWFSYLPASLARIRLAKCRCFFWPPRFFGVCRAYDPAGANELS